MSNHGHQQLIAQPVALEQSNILRRTFGIHPTWVKNRRHEDVLKHRSHMNAWVVKNQRDEDVKHLEQHENVLKITLKEHPKNHNQKQ